MRSYDTNINIKNINIVKKDTKMIIFDMDGTIANTTNLELDCFVKIFGKNKNFYKKYFGPPSNIIIQKLNPNFLKRKVKLYDHIWGKIYINSLKKHSWIDKNTKDILILLKTKYKIGIISSATKRTAILTLKELYGLFDFVLCAKEFKNHKPDPESLLFIMKHYNLKPKNIIYVGDNINDIVFGKNAKVKTIGKIDILYTKKQLTVYKPDLIIKNLSELKFLMDE